MCTCGCGQILLECNHVGCPNSTGEIADLHAQLDAGASDAASSTSSSVKYGPIALAAPVRGGFDNVAWIVPFAFLLLGIIADPAPAAPLEKAPRPPRPGHSSQPPRTPTPSATASATKPTTANRSWQRLELGV